MAWIEVHQSLPGHRKTLLCADLLDMPEAHVVGHLTMLWLWAVDNSPDGSLPNVTARMLAKAAGWERNPDELVHALLESEFLEQEDGEFIIHDWSDYAGKLLDQRESNRERQRRYREKKKTDTTESPNSDITVTSPSRHGATVPNRTVPNQTKEQNTVPVAEIIDHLNEKAGKHFRASSRATREHINARWREGYNLDDFMAVIDKKVAQWLNTDKEAYLRPSTLFNSEKFDGYVNEPSKPGNSRARDAPQTPTLGPSKRKEFERLRDEALAEAEAARQEQEGTV